MGAGSIRRIALEPSTALSRTISKAQEGLCECEQELQRRQGRSESIPRAAALPSDHWLHSKDLASATFLSLEEDKG